MKTLGKIAGKTKTNRIKSQHIGESCGIQPINEWANIRIELDEYVRKNGC